MRYRSLFPNLALCLVLLILFVAPSGALAQSSRGRGRPGQGEAAPPTAESDASQGTVNGSVASEALQEYARIAASFAYEDQEEKGVLFHQCRHVQAETLVHVLENFLTPAGPGGMSGGKWWSTKVGATISSIPERSPITVL